jgi:oligoendopeptidase F
MKYISIKLTLDQIQTAIDQSISSLAITHGQALAFFPMGDWTQYDLSAVDLGQTIIFLKNVQSIKRIELTIHDLEHTLEYLTVRCENLEKFYQKTTDNDSDIKQALSNITSEIMRLRKEIILKKKQEFSCDCPENLYNCLVGYHLIRV